MKQRQTPRTACPGRVSGFTLIELAIVLVILGILVSIALPQVLQAKQRAQRGSCLANQRNLMVATVLYSADKQVLDGEITSTVLHDNGYVTDELCDCPSSPEINFDDYTMALTDGKVVWIVCKVNGDEHVLGGVLP